MQRRARRCLLGGGCGRVIDGAAVRAIAKFSDGGPSLSALALALAGMS